MPGSSSGTASSGTSAAAGAFTLSTPSSAGGYKIGQDPDFLVTAKSEADQVTSQVAAVKGGTVKGSPLAAAYDLSVSGQVATVRDWSPMRLTCSVRSNSPAR